MKVEEGFGGKAGREGELWRVGGLSHYESGFGHVTMLLGLPKEKKSVKKMKGGANCQPRSR